MQHKPHHVDKIGCHLPGAIRCLLVLLDVIRAVSLFIILVPISCMTPNSLRVLKVARFLEVGVVLDYHLFAGFRVAFEPAEILWDIAPEPIIERAQAIQTGDRRDALPCLD